MASTSISHLIWFIVGITIASSVGMGIVALVQDMSDAMESSGRSFADDMRTQVELVNDPAAVPYDNSTGLIKVYAKNIGELELDTTTVVMVVNGTPLAGSNITVTLLGDTQWRPGIVAVLCGTVPGLRENIDYSLWVEITGLDGSGGRSGRDNRKMSFRIAD